MHKPWFLTCYAAGAEYVDEMRHMLETFHRHHPDVPTITGTLPLAGRDWHKMSHFKAEWLFQVHRAWRHLGDMLWVDADARFRKPFVPPVDVDVSSKRYGPPFKTAVRRVSTGTLWLANTAATARIVDHWRDHPHKDGNEMALPQALAAHEHRYHEMTDEDTSVCERLTWDRGVPWRGSIQHDSSIIHWNRSRNGFGCIEGDWPPSEHDRMNASVVTVSMFTSCYNQAETLPEAIDSVLAQTFPNWEYLLMDDGSTDDTWQIMQDYAAKDSRIRAMHLPKQQNLHPVMNRSVRESRGLFWCWVPADDRIEPTLLERKLQAANQHPGAVIYCHGQVMDGHAIEPPEWTPAEFREQLKHTCPIGLTGILVPLTVFDKAMFPEHELYSGDFAWMLQTCKAGVDWVCVPEILYHKRQHANTMTYRHRDEIYAGVERIRKEVGWHLGS